MTLVTIATLSLLFLVASLWALYLYVENAMLRRAIVGYLRVINDLIEGDE